MRWLPSRWTGYGGFATQKNMPRKRAGSRVWLGGIFAENCTERCHKEIGVRLRENQRGAELEDVVMGTVGAGENAAVAQPVYDVGGLRGSRFAGLAIADEVETKEKAGAADVPEERMHFLQCFEAREQVVADAQCIFLKMLAFEHI